MNIWQGKIPLSINPSFWVLSVLISWMNASSIETFALWMVVVFVSVVVHEFGHAISALVWGQTVEVELGPLGGLTGYRGKTLSRLKEFTVVFCGPFFGFLLYCLSLVMHKVAVIGPLSNYFWTVMVIANLFWTILNLLPVHPLDGGKLMGIVLEGIFGLRGMRISYFLSGLFALLFTAYFLFIGQMFAGAIFLLCAFESFSRFKKQRFFRTTANENLFTELEKAQEEWQQNERQSAIERLEKIVQDSKQGEAYTHAVEMLANFWLTTGEVQKTYTLLADNRKAINPQGLRMLQLASYKLGLYTESLDVGKQAFLENQDIACAILNAFSAARLRDAETAVNWLTAVKRAKPANFANITTASDLNDIRQNPLFQQFMLKST